MKRLGGIVDDFRARVDAAIADYQSAGARLAQSESYLYDVASIAQQDEHTAAEWQSNLEKVIAAQSTIEGVESAINSVRGFFNSIGEFFSLSGVKTRPLGFVFPAVPWALVGLITAGTAAMLVISDSVNSFVDRMSPGYVPKRSTIGEISDTVKWIIGGAVALMIVPELLKSRARK